ncbi:Uncharacterised protein [Acinetobacter baumannii]|nr:Uncharacterised protein [Acinetobacter baumannii]
MCRTVRHQDAEAPSRASISGSKRKGVSIGRCNISSRTLRIAVRPITTCSLRQSPAMLSSWRSLGAMITPRRTSESRRSPPRHSSCSPLSGRLRL